MTQPALPGPLPALPPPLPGEPPAPSAAPGPGPGLDAPVTLNAPRLPRPALRLLVFAAVFFLLALVAAAIGGWNYALVLHNASLRTLCLWVLIFTGGAATLLLGGTMNCLDRVLDLPKTPPWYARLPIDLFKRALLLLQLVTTAAALVALAVLVLHRDIPRF